jgi:hypothetical protein
MDHYSSIMRALESYQSAYTYLDSGLFLLSILASLIASFVASGLYRFFYESRATGSQVHRAFPLLGISITALFIGVQISLPLSLGLLGALSIIRFRTPIKEPEEIGFIMLVIAAAICSATLNFRFIIILYAVACAALVLVRGARTWRFLRRDGILVLTVPDEHAETGLRAVISHLGENVGRSRLESSSSRDGFTSLQFSFSGLKEDVAELQSGLRLVAPIHSINVFLDRPGGIR